MSASSTKKKKLILFYTKDYETFTTDDDKGFIPSHQLSSRYLTSKSHVQRMWNLYYRLNK